MEKTLKTQGREEVQEERKDGISRNEPRSSAASASGNRPATPDPGTENDTGLPDKLKSGIENLSGYSMDDVKVHYNSHKPAQLQAHAYTQGSDIYLAPGQEKHLPHEAWHAVQQKQGKVQPTLQMKGDIDINDDKGLEKEADVMGNKAAGYKQDQSKSKQPLKKRTSYSTQKNGVIQRYVILGYEDSGWRHTFGLAKPTMRKMLEEKDLPQVENDLIKYYASLPHEHDPGKKMSPKNVAVWKGLGPHALRNFGAIKTKLREWVTSMKELRSTMSGDQAQAHWRQYEDIEELALALAHETLPAYMENVQSENALADTVNESSWIEEKLIAVKEKVDQFMKKNMSTLRHNIIEPLENQFTGSYNLGTGFGLEQGSSEFTDTKESITNNIKFLHDVMERLSDGNAGSTVAAIHNFLGAKQLLFSAEDRAYETTMIDEDASDFTTEVPIISLVRETRLNTQEDRDKVIASMAKSEAKKMIEKLRNDIEERKNLLEDLEEGENDKKRKELEKIEKRIAIRKGRLVQESPKFDFDNLTIEDVNIAELPTADSEEIPKRGYIAKNLIDRKKEREEEKLKKVEPGKVDKSSGSKGRRNVGTRLESAPDTLMARLFSAPVSAGRSMTTARLMQLTEKAGGTDEEKTAVAYALFAYWARTYNKGLTPIHTYVETMDVAKNYGVPYKPFQYPQPNDKGKIDFMNPVRHKKMSDSLVLNPRNSTLHGGASASAPAKTAKNISDLWDKP